MNPVQMGAALVGALFALIAVVFVFYSVANRIAAVLEKCWLAFNAIAIELRDSNQQLRSIHNRLDGIQDTFDSMNHKLPEQIEPETFNA